jgi:hypothetical protein
MASDLIIDRRSGNCEEEGLFPSMLERHCVDLIDANNRIYRSIEGIEFHLTPDRLEVYSADLSAGFSEVQSFLGLIGWRQAKISGNPDWVRKVVAYPGSVEFLTDEDQMRGQYVAAEETHQLHTPIGAGLREVEQIVPNEDAMFPTCFDSAPARVETVTTADRREPVWLACEKSAKGTVSITEEPELLEAQECIKRYLARIGFSDASISPQVYLSIQNGDLAEFTAEFVKVNVKEF